MSRKKDYIGRVMAQRPALLRQDRPSFVGFRPVDRGARLRAGAHFLQLGDPAEAALDQGFMSSVAYSPMLEGWIGLGFLAGGQDRIGETLRAYDPLRDGDIPVEVCAPIFFDPEGARARA
jgi:glycine cleavage system aminomethyltransferase T